MLASDLDEAGGNQLSQVPEDRPTDIQRDSATSSKTCLEQVHQEVESGVVISLMQAITENAATALLERCKIDHFSKYHLVLR